MTLYGEVRNCTDKNGDLLLPSGEYRRLKSFQLKVKSPYLSVLVANAVLLLIDTASCFLKRQIGGKAEMFF